MKRTINMGVGYIMVVSEKESGDTISLLNNAGYKAFIIGVIEKGGRNVRYS
jgi:phosphoribosylaminoimidazole (AIR) synthetase